VGFLERILDLAQRLGRAVAHFPGHREILVGLDRAVLLAQIPHMAVGSEHRVLVAQVLVDRLCLGG